MRNPLRKLRGSRTLPAVAQVGAALILQPTPSIMQPPPRPRDLLPSRAGARWNAGKPFSRTNVVDSDNAADNATVHPANERRPAGTGPTLRRRSGRIMLALMRRWSFPAHTRTAKRRNAVGPPRRRCAVFRPFGLGQKVFCPLGSRSRGRGSSIESTPWVVQRSLRPKTPSLRSPRAERPTCRVQPVPASLRHRPDSAIGLARLVAGEPPNPVPLGRKLQASGGRVPASRCPGRPQHQPRGQPFPRQPACRMRSISHAGPRDALASHRAPNRRSQRVVNPHGDRRHQSGSRRNAGNRPVPADRPENGPRGSRTRRDRQAAKVMTPLKIQGRGG